MFLRNMIDTDHETKLQLLYLLKHHRKALVLKAICIDSKLFYTYIRHKSSVIESKKGAPLTIKIRINH